MILIALFAIDYCINTYILYTGSLIGVQGMCPEALCMVSIMS